MIDVHAALETLRTGEEARRRQVVDELGASRRPEAVPPLLVAVAWAIWAMSWLERLTDSLMRRRASPALSASWIPSRVSSAPALAVSTALVVSAWT